MCVWDWDKRVDKIQIEMLNGSGRGCQGGQSLNMSDFALWGTKSFTSVYCQSSGNGERGAYARKRENTLGSGC